MKSTVAISNRGIGSGHPAFIVAEIGANHDGDLDKALDMIESAKLAGADAVKFQSFLANELVQRNHPEYGYLKKTEMPKAWYPKLREAGERNDIIVFSTASNYTTLEWMEELDFPCYKIASGNLTHLPLIRRVAGLGKPIIMSTGFSGMTEIQKAVLCVRGEGNSRIILLHCVGNYPADPREVNLKTIGFLKEEFSCVVGYSDHTIGELACKTAAAIGASVIEKHVTWDQKKKEGDHAISSNFLCFGLLVKAIREMEGMMGVPAKAIGEKERRGSLHARRALHASRDIPAGTEITEDMILFLRPTGRLESLTWKPSGLPPAAIDWVVGKKAARAIRGQSPISWQNLVL